MALTQVNPAMLSGSSNTTTTIQSNGVTAITVDASQNVGIGTASPAAKLDVAGTIQGLQVFQSSSGADLVLNANGANRDVIVKVNNTELSRFTGSGGNLLVGKTSSNGAIGSFGSPIVSTQGNGFSNYNGTTTVQIGGVNGNEGIGFTSTAFRVYNASAVGVYLVSGNTSWTATSDERLKTDLKPIENATDKVNQLRSVTGRFKSDEEGTSRSFLIAQDVKAVLPEAVDSTDPEKLGVQYTDVIPLLVAAIKELNAKVDAQAAEIKALKG